MWLRGNVIVLASAIATCGRPHDLNGSRRLQSRPPLRLAHETPAGALAMVTDPKSIRRYLAKVGEPTEPPARSPSRGPLFWKSVVLRQKMLGSADLGA